MSRLSATVTCEDTEAMSASSESISAESLPSSTYAVISTGVTRRVR